jgi:hypothetical protein
MRAGVDGAVMGHGLYHRIGNACQPCCTTIVPIRRRKR